MTDRILRQEKCLLKSAVALEDAAAVIAEHPDCPHWASRRVDRLICRSELWAQRAWEVR